MNRIEEIKMQAFCGMEIKGSKGICHTFPDLTEEKQNCEGFQNDLRRMAAYYKLGTSDADKLRLFNVVARELSDALEESVNEMFSGEVA